MTFWLITSACILTPEIEAEAPEIYYAPEILLDSLSPKDSGRFEIDKDCSPAVFRVGQVRERNKDDTLAYTWLVDWNSEIQTQPGWSFIGPDREEVRVGPQTLIDLNLYLDDQFHTLKVFIADRYPKSLGENGVDFFEDSAGQYTSYQWTFKVISGGGICADGGSGT